MKTGIILAVAAIALIALGRSAYQATIEGERIEAAMRAARNAPIDAAYEKCTKEGGGYSRTICKKP